MKFRWVMFAIALFICLMAKCYADTYVEEDWLATGKITGTTTRKTGLNSTPTNLMTLKVCSTFNGSTGVKPVKVDNVSIVIVTGTVSGTTGYVVLTKNATLGGTPTYYALSGTTTTGATITGSSTVSVDTAGTTVTGGTQIVPILAVEGVTNSMDFRQRSVYVKAGDTLTLAIVGDGTITARASVRLIEGYGY